MDSLVEKKLKALLKLQSIDSALDEIKKVRGDLPEEVSDLEDEIAGYETRVSKFEGELANLEQTITDKKLAIKESEKLILKYQEQQNKVRNNREYDAITKEVELQELEIQISEKKIKEAGYQIETKQKDIAETRAILEGRQDDLKRKKDELDQITGESVDDEAKLMGDREKAEKSVDERLLYSYDRIRGNARNGLAVVSVRRDACGGCFNRVPPQRQADIRDKKKMIVCEHCGRILADAELVIEEEKPKKRKKAVSAK